MTPNWEHDFFVWTPPSGRYAILDNNNSRLSVCQEWWQDDRISILSEIEKWYNRGWEPIGTVGPECYQVREYSKVVFERMLSNPTDSSSILGCLVTILATIGTFGLFLLYLFLSKDTYIEATSFTVQMHRQMNI